MPTNDSIPADIPPYSHDAGTVGTGAILLITGDAELRERLEVRLLSAGFDVRVVDNGDDALDSLFETLPALIVVDGGLPGMDAYAFTQKIRSFDEARFTPVIMVAVHDDVAVRIQAYQVGIDDVREKPVDVDEMVARVQSLLRSRLLYQNLLDENGELQAAHDAHRDAQQLYRGLFTASPTPVFAVDPQDLTVIFASDSAAHLTGYDPETLTGTGLGLLCPGEVGSEWLERLCSEVAIDGDVRIEEGTIVIADGRRVPVEAALGRTVSGGAGSRAGAPSPAGWRTVVILTLSDLRSRNESDLARLTAERTSMLRETAIAVNSRVNDPLFVILNDIASLQAAMKTVDPSVQSRLARILEAAQRIQRVTAQLSAITTVVTKEYLPGVRMLDLDESTT